MRVRLRLALLAMPINSNQFKARLSCYRDRRRGKSDVKSHKIANNVTVISYRIDLCQRKAAKARLIIMRSPGHCYAASHAVVWQTFGCRAWTLID